jgi:hypothetical protein
MQASHSSGCKNDIALHGGGDTHSSALVIRLNNGIVVLLSFNLYELVHTHEVVKVSVEAQQ